MFLAIRAAKTEGATVINADFIVYVDPPKKDEGESYFYVCMRNKSVLVRGAAEFVQEQYDFLIDYLNVQNYNPKK